MQSPQSPTFLQDAHCLIVSNRGPVEYSVQADGSWHYQRGLGGMVTALLSIGSLLHATWVALAISPGDYQAVATLQRADRLPPAFEHLRGINLRYVAIPAEALHRHYGIISNRVLWFLQHYLFHQLQPEVSEAELHDAWTQGYVVANRALATAVLAEMQRSPRRPVVLIHDYFLCLVAGLLRAQQPDAALLQFLHCPWPEFRYWQRLPDSICQQLFTGLLANDILGFQTPLDACNFLLGVPLMLNHEARIDLGQMTATYRGHTTRVRAYPIGTLPEQDLREAGELASFPELAPLVQARQRQQRIILRVDRLDPSKQIVPGFAAYEHLLATHAQLREQVIFLALCVPARESIGEYRRYRAEVQAAIERINRLYATATWQPIEVIYGNNRARALTALQEFDVLLANVAADGMNLLVKEGIAVNRRQGVVVLSRTAGAYQQLHDAVLPVAPYSVEETAAALYTALTMAPEDKQRLHEAGQQVISASTQEHWLARQLADLARI
ncbi:MAG TPA: trehalose-6-phosphate synthase [Ktedonobacteraceae bacterium]|jgi:trehalose 6-phosphate synthase